MKQFIVFISTIALGIFLYHLIAGGDSGSLLSFLEQFFRSEIERKGQ